MGIELNDMNMHQLEDVLFETSKFNDKDFQTFKEAMLDMYGGINTRNLKRITDYVESELGLKSDADLTHLDTNQKEKILEFATKLE